MHNLFSMQGKIIVITGGLGQLGRQFAISLLEYGARVAIFDLHVTDKTIKKRFCNEYENDRLFFKKVDITKRSEIEEGLSQIIDRWKMPPNGLVNNAALDSPPNAPAEENGPFETYPAASWDKVMEVNVKGTMQCCQVIGGQMAKSGGGSIINISSTYGLVSPDQSIYSYRRKDSVDFYKPISYSASKSAILNLTRYLATYWAKKNVRVNTLTFAGVFNNQNPEFLKNYCSKIPIGRMAHEDEYNGAVIFLLSDAASYMTGSNLVIDGGWTAW